MKSRKTRKTRSRVADIESAEKKLRQSGFFLGWLENMSQELARDCLRGSTERVEHLEFYFSACLSAAKSVYYILSKFAGQKFKGIEKEWRDSLKDDPGGSRFNGMLDLRDEDVHVGDTGAKPLEKYIEEDHWGRGFPYHQPMHYNAAIFGPAPVTEMENPDGEKVRGSVLRGTVGLYLDREGKPVEAITACCEFIDQLRSLLEATKAATARPPVA